MGEACVEKSVHIKNTDCGQVRVVMTWTEKLPASPVISVRLVTGDTETLTSSFSGFKGAHLASRSRLCLKFNLSADRRMCP